MLSLTDYGSSDTTFICPSAYKSVVNEHLGVVGRKNRSRADKSIVSEHLKVVDYKQPVGDVRTGCCR